MAIAMKVRANWHLWPARSFAAAKAFTLVELLVVIGVIALLAGMLMPALAGARRSAESIVCLSQLRQIGAAALMYANDHDGVLPRSSHAAMAFRSLPWGFALKPYLDGQPYGGDDRSWQKLFQGVYRCPADARRQQWSYGKNVWFELTAAETGEIAGNSAGPTYHKLNHCRCGPSTILIGEIDSQAMADHVMAHFWLMGGQPEIDATRHGRTSNYLFIDGHAESLKFEATFQINRSVDRWNPATAR
jgi:prepilin-type processing-associated H-X9-DG protein/prepilin-type N-terminal cleavage/methylation domain-containing protein